jgi:phage tail sheath protein FI
VTEPGSGTDRLARLIEAEASARVAASAGLDKSTRWQRVASEIERFLGTLLAAGTLRGRTPQEAFFVKIEGQITASDLDHGSIAIVIGFAPERPAEFVVITLQQISQGGSG